MQEMKAFMVTDTELGYYRNSPVKFFYNREDAENFLNTRKGWGGNGLVYNEAEDVWQDRRFPENNWSIITEITIH